MTDADSLPLVHPLDPAPRPEWVFERLSSRSHCLWLDSALPHATLGRFSFLTADPVEFLVSHDATHDSLADVARRLAKFPAATVPGLPPFQGGAAGLLGYELARSLERIPAAGCDEFGVPVVALGLYDVVLCWDHATDRAWIVSQGYPERDPARRRRRAAERLDEFLRRLSEPPNAERSSPAAAHLVTQLEGGAPLASRADVRFADLALCHPLVGADLPAGLASNFSASGYRDTVERAIEYIRAGDIFQVNLSQRFLYPATDDAAALYRRLRRFNPGTFAAYFDLGEFQLASASPERFLQVRDGLVETRPIKGTRRRMKSAEANLFMGDDLLQSEKDRAENVMIVDLLRNDLARVCRPESVRVTQLCELETYEYVLHLVSAVEGRLADGRGPLDLIRAAFPGGSITGAPKIRAMEIIAELEPTVRGPYCGSIGYVGFDGAVDLNILIRTITTGRGWRQFPAGGGVVAQSRPQSEYEETWHKAAGLIRSLR